jgi:hypothetical protein
MALDTLARTLPHGLQGGRIIKQAVDGGSEILRELPRRSGLKIPGIHWLKRYQQARFAV